MAGGDTRNPNGSDSASKTAAIIQCPACQTKFAVPTKQLESVKNPRFHCSRCDHVFSIDELIGSLPSKILEVKPAPPLASNKEKTPTQVPVQSVIAPKEEDEEEEEETLDDPDGAAEVEDYFNEDVANKLEEDEYEEEEEEEEEELEANEADDDNIDNKAVDEELDEDQEEEIEEEDKEEFQEKLGAKSSASKVDLFSKDNWPFSNSPFEEKALRDEEPQSLKTPKSKATKFKDERIDFPFEEREEDIPFLSPSSEEEDEEAQDEVLSWMDKVLPLQNKNQETVRSIKPAREEDDWFGGYKKHHTNIQASKTVGALASPTISRKATVPTEPAKPTLKPRTAREVVKPTPTISPVQTSLSDMSDEAPRSKWIFFFGFLMAIGVVGLGALSIFAMSSPELRKSLMSIALNTAPARLPDGLYINDVEFKKFTLDNGEEISAITGKVVNKSERIFKEVVISGGVFDKKGMPIAQIKANLSSPVHKTRIKSITSEMVQKLTQQGGSKSFKLKPSEEISFTLPLVNESPEVRKALRAKAAYFNARVFSAE